MLEVLCWWGVLASAWLVTTTSVTLTETMVAVVVAGPCAVCGWLVRRAYGFRWSADPRWSRWLGALPSSLARDGVRVACLLAPGAGARSRGELREIRMPSGAGADRGFARSALATLAVSATPGSFVVRTSDRGRLLIHTLGDATPIERAVAR